MRSAVFVLIILFSSQFVFAGKQIGKVEMLAVHDNGAGIEKVDVKVSGTATDMDWCSPYNTWTLALQNEASKAQFSMLLAAYISGLDITIESDDAKVCPDGTRNRVRNVRLLQ